MCVGSVEELKVLCEESVRAGHMSKNPLENFVPGDMSEANYDCFDLHKNYVYVYLCVYLYVLTSNLLAHISVLEHFVQLFCDRTVYLIVPIRKSQKDYRGS